MTKKSILTLFVVLSFAITASSQFSHSVGAGLVYGRGKAPKGSESVSGEKPTIMGYGIFYYPRFNVIENESGAISIGIPLTAGLSGSYNSREGGAMSVILDLPVTADYNFGGGSTKDNESGFGGFVGAGFGYTYSNYTEEFYIPGVIDSYEQVKGTSYGPVAHGGIKLSVGQNLTFFARAFYKVGLESAKFKTFGIAGGLCF
jgi:hypothetical protein